MERLPAVALAALVLLGGVVPAVGAGAVAPASATDARSGSQPQVRADPATDRIGWEDGYWHDDPIDVDQSDGLSDDELDAYVARAMARVEFLREAEFDGPVPVEVVDREAYRERTADDGGDPAFGAWNNQVWEGLFVDGENSDVQSELGATFGASVAGFYAPDDDRIRIVTDSPDSPTVDNATLVHELVHALQDQEVDLTSEQLRAPTQDGDLAIDGLVEGEANLIEALYTRRCGAEWDCVATPPSDGSGGDDPNLGILLTILQPYSDGPVYVEDLRAAGGWAAVRAAFDDPPASTEQVIHLTDEEPVPIEYTDRARGGWEPFPDQGENGSDTVGEASIYTMLWHQARTSGAETVSPRSLGRTDAEFDLYNYAAEPSAGWGNDRLFPYRRADGAGADAEGGYVWVTEWDTPADAREFHEAHRAILRAHDAERRADGIRVIPDGPFADAFRIVRTGTRVVVVNGPTPEAVDDLRPGLADGTARAAAGSSADGGTAGVDEDRDAPAGPSDVVAPGLGPLAVLAALAALAAAALVRRRRR